MVIIKFDTIDFNKTMNNVIDYSNGFLDGIEMEKIDFNRFLGGYTVAALEKYIDSRSRMNPLTLHHVYEPGRVGDEGARLFSFNVISNKNNINITGKFLPSKGTPLNGGTPFINKAEIMENDISITITPRRSSLLAFEDGGELIFTRNSITIDHPGGDGVAGSFGETVDNFFNNYFKVSILKSIMNNLKSADEFVQDFSYASKSGRSAGVRAGRKYFEFHGEVA